MASLLADLRPHTPLRWSARLGYAVGDFGCNLYWQSVALFLYFFYTDVLNIPPAAAGVAFAIASVYDAVADPIMGAIADRTRTRWGRLRPYLWLGAVPLALSFAAMFYAPKLDGMALLAYATVSHVVMRTCYTAVNIPYLALSARLSSDAGERATLAGLRMMFAAAAGVLVAALLPRVVAVLGGEMAYFVVASGIGLLATLALLLCASSVRELPHPAPDVDGARSTSLLKAASADFLSFWPLLLRYRPLAQIVGGVVVMSIALTMFSKCLIYWFKYGLQRPEMIPAALLVPALMIFLCSPVWSWVARRYSKRNAWIAGCAVAGCGYLGFWLNGSAAMPVVLAWIALVGAGVSSLYVNMWAMLPDTVELIEWRGGGRNEAKVAGFAVFAQKAALAVNAVLLGFLLDAAGFVSNQALSTSTLAGIKAVMCGVPLLGVIISFLLVRSYPISPAFHAQIVEELARKKAA